MYTFLANNTLFIVLIIALICWGGILWYLFWMDKRISHLEKQTDHK
ncbi:MAG: CcmD family protein [Bacteroidota bacterium]